MQESLPSRIACTEEEQMRLPESVVNLGDAPDMF